MPVSSPPSGSHTPRLPASQTYTNWELNGLGFTRLQFTKLPDKRYDMRIVGQGFFQGLINNNSAPTEYKNFPDRPRVVEQITDEMYRSFFRPDKTQKVFLDEINLFLNQHQERIEELYRSLEKQLHLYQDQASSLQAPEILKSIETARKFLHGIRRTIAARVYHTFAEREAILSDYKKALEDFRADQCTAIEKKLGEKLWEQYKKYTHASDAQKEAFLQKDHLGKLNALALAKPLDTGIPPNNTQTNPPPPVNDPVNNNQQPSNNPVPPQDVADQLMPTLIRALNTIPSDLHAAAQATGAQLNKVNPTLQDAIEYFQQVPANKWNQGQQKIQLIQMICSEAEKQWNLLNKKWNEDQATWQKFEQGEHPFFSFQMKGFRKMIHGYLPQASWKLSLKEALKQLPINQIGTFAEEWHEMTKELSVGDPGLTQLLYRVLGQDFVGYRDRALRSSYGLSGAQHDDVTDEEINIPFMDEAKKFLTTFKKKWDSVCGAPPQSLSSRARSFMEEADQEWQKIEEKYPSPIPLEEQLLYLSRGANQNEILALKTRIVNKYKRELGVPLTDATELNTPHSSHTGLISRWQKSFGVLAGKAELDTLIRLRNELNTIQLESNGYEIQQMKKKIYDTQTELLKQLGNTYKEQWEKMYKKKIPLWSNKLTDILRVPSYQEANFDLLLTRLQKLSRETQPLLNTKTNFKKRDFESFRSTVKTKLAQVAGQSWYPHLHASIVGEGDQSELNRLNRMLDACQPNTYNLAHWAVTQQSLYNILDELNKENRSAIESVAALLDGCIHQGHDCIDRISKAHTINNGFFNTTNTYTLQEKDREILQARTSNSWGAWFGLDVNFQNNNLALIRSMAERVHSPALKNHLELTTRMIENLQESMIQDLEEFISLAQRHKQVEVRWEHGIVLPWELAELEPHKSILKGLLDPGQRKNTLEQLTVKQLNDLSKALDNSSERVSLRMQLEKKQQEFTLFMCAYSDKVNQLETEHQKAQYRKKLSEITDEISAYLVRLQPGFLTRHKTIVDNYTDVINMYESKTTELSQAIQAVPINAERWIRDYVAKTRGLVTKIGGLTDKLGNELGRITTEINQYELDRLPATQAIAAAQITQLVPSFYSAMKDKFIYDLRMKIHHLSSVDSSQFLAHIDTLATALHTELTNSTPPQNTAPFSDAHWVKIEEIIQRCNMYGRIFEEAAKKGGITPSTLLTNALKGFGHPLDPARPLAQITDDSYQVATESRDDFWKNTDIRKVVAALEQMQTAAGIPAARPLGEATPKLFMQ